MANADRFSQGAAPPPGPGGDPAHDEELDGGGPAAMQRLQRQLEELAEFARYYMAAKADAISGAVRRAILWLIIGILGTLLAGALLVTSMVLLLVGLAGLIGGALGDRLWAGNLITGGGLLLGVGLILMVTMSSLTRSSRERTVRRYARRRQQQKARFGHDVTEQAAAGRHRGGE